MKTLVLFIVVFIATNCGTQKQMNESEISQKKSDNTFLGVWNILSIKNEKLNSNNAKITFEADNHVMATIGCNMHRGSFTINEDKLSIGELISTEKYCKDLDKLETALRKELSAITHYKLDNNELLLLSNNTITFVLKRP